MAKKPKKPVFGKKDGTEGPGRLFLKKGEKPEDGKKRLSEKYNVPDDAKHDKATNSFVPAGREPAFKKAPKKSTDAIIAGDDKADWTDEAGKKWSLKEGETLEELKLRAKGKKAKPEQKRDKKGRFGRKKK